ncbi:MAG: GNAT family N-acetyltransferase [Lactobacillaceae bacterium]|jgi:predicted GNAT family N-acyltransferase|nr:GNAT family N-acetyltransferase [Lactobacillaceae bacterium]
MKKFIDIPFGSTRYDELVELRYKVLLEPLGLKFLDMHREKEANYLHIGCIESLDDKLVGGLILIPLNDKEIRLMQVAVDGKHQGEGVGRDLIKHAEKRAKEAGYTKIVMHAMLSVVNFYEKLNFVQEGDLFEEKGITFVRMTKPL